MFQHLVYQCPKCFNTLLFSNKFLHDLRCTEENPATYENMLFRLSQIPTNDSSYNNNYNNNSNDFGISSRMTIKNYDGTTTDIVKEKNMKGQEEFIEVKYDPQGNIIGRKRAGVSIGYTEVPSSFQEYNEYYDYDNNYETSYDNNNNTYYEVNNEVEVRNEPSIIYKTAEVKEIVYTAPAQYDPHVIINQPIIKETVINNDGSISSDILNSIIRNTMNMPNRINYNDYGFQNNINLNTYDKSQNCSRINDKTNTNNQEYNMNNYDFGTNNINNEIRNDTYGQKADNLKSYDYQY